MVHELFIQLKIFFANYIRKLMNQSKKCAEKFGDYIQK
jgi:hypothetical protein